MAGADPNVLLPLLGAPVAILGISLGEVVLPRGSFIIVIIILLHVLCDVTSVKVASKLAIFILIERISTSKTLAHFYHNI